MQKLFFFMSLLIIPQVVYCSAPQKPVAPQAQRDAKKSAEAGTQTSTCAEQWRSAQWKVLAGIHRAKLQHFTRPIKDESNEELKRKIAQVELALAQRTKERDQLGHAFERAKELKAEVTTKEHTIKLLQGQNRKLAAENKTLINKHTAKSQDELP